MRITIDATSLLLPGAGVKNHIYYWLLSLQAAAPARGVVINTYPPLLSAGALDHQLDHSRSVPMRLVQLANLAGSPLLDLVLARSDVFHCSQHLARIPWRVKSTATIFDLSCWTHPDTHTPENVAATKRYAERILKRCDRLIANSASAQRDAFEILGIPMERIRVIPPGVAESFFQVRPEDVPPIRATYGLPPAYLLFVGCIEPRKNIRALVRAFRDLPERIRREIPLALAGPFGWESYDIRPLLTGKDIRYLGYVPEVDLPALFAGAAAFVYPSLYEGFGLPVAQAMAAGVPVITSNCSSLPEVVGDCGITVDPKSIPDLTAAIYGIITRPDVAADLRARGKDHARAFHWSAAAAASIDFFCNLAGRS